MSVMFNTTGFLLMIAELTDIFALVDQGNTVHCFLPWPPFEHKSSIWYVEKSAQNWT